MNRILIFLSVLTIALWTACEDKISNPLITFENGVDSITEVFPGDVFQVKGTIIAEEPLAGTFYFLQKKDAAGKLDETGDRLELEQEGTTSGSFFLEVNVETAIVGVKIIAEDAKGNRTVKIFKVIQGIDEIDITLEELAFLEDINTGDSFQVKGKATSKTKIIGLNYRIIKGDITENPVDITVTDDVESAFDISLVARNGWTGVLITATNKSGLVAEKLFEIKHITHIGPSILFDQEKVEVRPNSTLTVTGKVVSDWQVGAVSYVIERGTATDPSRPIVLSDQRFSFQVDNVETVTAVKVTAIDEKGNEGEATLPVTFLIPVRTEGNSMVHYKNIILTDNPSRGYFSFSLAPYVLGKEQATANQDKVDLIYSNLFIGEENTNNGPAIFGPNVNNASTIKAPYMVEGWTTLNFTRIPVANDFFSVTGVTFDEIPDSKEAWDQINTYLKSKIGSSSVVRQKNLTESYMFAIGFDGTDNATLKKFAIVIVRGFGGEKATSTGQSTGAWVEIEIKMSK
jgi:hypothetical protein